MQNEYLDNKIALKYCPNYYKIINEEYTESDTVSSKVIQVLQATAFKVNIRNKKELNKVTMLDKAILRYFEDREFKKQLSYFLMHLHIPHGTSNIMEYISDGIIKEYDRYIEGYTRNLYISRWI